MKLISASKLGKLFSKYQWWFMYLCGAYIIGRFLIGVIFGV